MRRQKLVVIGYGQRGRIYAKYSLANPEQFEVVAIVDNSEDRRVLAKREFDCPVFDDYEDFLQAKIPADIVAIAIQDKDHLECSIKVMEAGYDLLLEKPIATSLEDCEKIYECSVKNNRKVVVCHVLRFTPFYKQVKKIIDDGILGRVIAINASENVGYYHQSHSFVRGPWRNKAESSPMILAKCCHDLDILRWLVGAKCDQVASFGSLAFFKEECAPKESAKYCSDCPVKDCQYRAKTLYDNYKWMRSYFSIDEFDDEKSNKALIHSQYDRCVFKCDNDVVDNQVSIFNFNNGVVVNHTMTAFSKEIYRDIKVHGTLGELYGLMEKNILEVRLFGGETIKYEIDPESLKGNHGGGDNGIMYGLYLERNGQMPKDMTYLDVSIDSHRMAFAAEKARVENKIIKI